jgi:hypothetical protein
MASGQDKQVAVNDLVLSTVVKMSPQDAVNATRKFPARYTFNDPDPQVGVPMLSTFLANDVRLPVPTVTGSKGANAALTSLITTLAKLGLVLDSTT